MIVNFRAAAANLLLFSPQQHPVCRHSRLLTLPLPFSRQHSPPSGKRGGAKRQVEKAAATAAAAAGAASFIPEVMSAVSVPPPGYRANVGVCLVNTKNEVFVASRLDVPGSWQMPQGGVDQGEEPREAAFRELREETGITSAQVIGEVPVWLTYDFPPDVKAKITKLWGKEWTGQAQKWFLFRFTGDESEVDLAGDGKEAAEFDEWKWLPIADVIKAAVEFKKPVYEQVFRVFGPILDESESK